MQDGTAFAVVPKVRDNIASNHNDGRVSQTILVSWVPLRALHERLTKMTPWSLTDVGDRMVGRW